MGGFYRHLSKPLGYSEDREAHSLGTLSFHSLIYKLMGWWSQSLWPAKTLNSVRYILRHFILSILNSVRYILFYIWKP